MVLVTKKVILKKGIFMSTSTVSIEEGKFNTIGYFDFAGYGEVLARQSAHCQKGEYRLMLAIFEDAIHCIQQYYMRISSNEEKLFDEAEEWMMSGEEEWIFSFYSICKHLDWDPEWIRDGMKRWLEVRRKGSYARPKRTLPRNSSKFGRKKKYLLINK